MNARKILLTLVSEIDMRNKVIGFAMKNSANECVGSGCTASDGLGNISSVAEILDVLVSTGVPGRRDCGSPAARTGRCWSGHERHPKSNSEFCLEGEKHVELLRVFPSVANA